MTRRRLAILAVAVVLGCRRKTAPTVQPEPPPSAPFVASASASVSASAAPSPTLPPPDPNVVLAQGLSKTPIVAVDASTVYWVSDRKLFAADKTGAAPKVLATAPAGKDIKVADVVAGQLYFAIGREGFHAYPDPANPSDEEPPLEIWTRGPGATAPRKLVDLAPYEPAKFYASGTSVCLSTIHPMTPMQLVSGAACFDPAKPDEYTFIDHGADNAYRFSSSPSIAVTPTLLIGTLFDDSVDPKPELMAVKYSPTKDAYETPPVAMLSIAQRLGSHAVHGNHVYWYDDTSIYALDTAAPKLKQVVVAKTTHKATLAPAVDEKHVYWLEQPKTTLFRVARTGGAPSPVVTTAAPIQAFALNGDAVYFVADGKLVRRPKDP